jgi:hypothetical protein
VPPPLSTGEGRFPISQGLAVPALVWPAASGMPKAQVAQLVEQRTENPRVGGSIPPLGTSINQQILS